MNIYAPSPPTLLDRFSPERLKRILPTSTTPKVDVFKSYRPKRGQNLDYTISQTFANLEQGDTVIHLKETTATYTPKPPKKERKRGQLFSGGPPQWKFVDEIREEIIEELQVKHRKQLVERLARKKKATRHNKKGQHNEIQELVGPEWFQELSPQQLATIDRLRYCIHADLAINCFVNTQENLARLGLVLRPNKSHLKYALRHCCGDPVEFLLILYQIMKPNRDAYSLNDRLILSSVVHLTIAETFRELHVRIPSPPRAKEEPPKPPKKKKKNTYESPYLEPLTYYPKPRRFHGIYYDKHRQHPESPYFAYLYFLRAEQLLVNSIPYVDIDEDIEKELAEAQTFYESLPGGSDMPRLLAPNQKFICPENVAETVIRDPSTGVIRVPIPTLVKLSSPDFDKCDCTDRKVIDDYQTIIKSLEEEDPVDRRCGCKLLAKNFLEGLCNCKACQAEKWRRSFIPVFGGVVATNCGRGIPVIAGVLVAPSCDCLEMYVNKLRAIQEAKRLSQIETRYVVTGLAMTPLGPCYILCSAMASTSEEHATVEDTDDGEMYEDSSTTITEDIVEQKCRGCRERAHALLKKTEGSLNICSCLGKYRKQIEEHENGESLREGQRNLKLQKQINYIIGGVVKTEEGIVYNIAGQKMKNRKKKEKPKQGTEKICCCKRKQYEETESSSERSDNEEEASAMLLTNQCNCNKYNMMQGQQKKMSQPQNTCSCVEKYRKQIQKRGNGEVLREGKRKLKLQKQINYIIGGVVKTEDGPVYNIAGQKIRNRKKREKPKQETGKKEDMCTTDHATGVKKKCCCKRKSEERQEELESASEEPDSEEDWCRCGEAIETRLKNRCDCEKCNMMRRQHNATFVISGTKCTESGTVVNVMSGVKSNECSCLHYYYEKLKKVFDYRKRCKIRLKLMQRPDTYVVSGVHTTPQGPVYSLSCVKPPPECECGRILRELREVEERIAQMAKMPETGRVKYVVSGVKSVQGENVYVLSTALPTEDCQCMQLVNEFEEVHAGCLEMYEEFLKTVDEEIAAYVEDIANDERWAVTEPCDYSCEGLPGEFPDNEYPCDGGEGDSEMDDGLNEYLRQVNEDLGEGDFLSEENDTDENPCTCCTCYKQSNASLIPEVVPIVLPKPPPSKEDERKQKVERKPSYESKRFHISGEYPKSKGQQIDILKRILEGMALDGFPLAKLPHSYKLPHFRLWWHLRRGTYWTLKDKIDSIGWSKAGWKHSDLCYTMPHVSTLRLDKCKALEFTWKHAKWIKKICADKEHDFYRRLRQHIIESTRELYALTYSYEFPTKTFRDCFFAYQPAKEEEVFPFKVVTGHEHPEIPRYRQFPCYC